MKLGLAQINPRLGDFDRNCQKILEKIEEARKQKVHLLIFPELSVCGYPPRDLLDFQEFHERMEKTLRTVAEATSSISVLVGCVTVNPGPGAPYFNAAALLRNKKIECFIHKQLLPTYDVFEERRYFEPGAETVVISVEGKKIGVTICEDIWNLEGFVPKAYARDPLASLKPGSIDLLVNLSASPFHLGKPKTREELFSKVAKKVGAPLAFCNQWGANDELIFDGTSSVTSAEGKLLARAKSFSDDLLVWESKQEKIASDRPEMAWIHDALVTGISDYFGKTGFKTACLGVSGGIDSAVAAALVAEALGPENVFGVCLPTRFTSKESLNDSETLCANLKIPFRILGIETFYQLFENLWREWFRVSAKSLTLENFQPRLRMSILMALANERNSLVLNTSNKSELSAGYATQYGDSAGALSVLGDLTKGQVYALAHFINRDSEKIPRPIIERPPTAELKENQFDQDTLPPYPVLDALVEQSVVKSEGFLTGKGAHADTFWRLHRISEYKRHQFPPILRVSPRAFGMGRRIPLTAYR